MLVSRPRTQSVIEAREINELPGRQRRISCIVFVALYGGDTGLRVRRGTSARHAVADGAQARAQILPQYRFSLVRSVGLREDERRRLRVDTVNHRSAIVERRENRLHVLWEPERRLCQRVEVREFAVSQHQGK